MANILVYVEDDNVARDAFANYFRRKKYEVHVFETASAAEQALGNLKPNVIISDQKLGQDSLGWEFLKRTIALCPNSIRMILSGYSEAQMVLHSFLEGVVFDYISKSASNEEIEMKIANACKFSELLYSNNNTTENRDALINQLVLAKKETKVLADMLQEKEKQVSELRNKSKK